MDQYRPGFNGPQFIYNANVSNNYYNQGPGTDATAEAGKVNPNSEDDESELRPQYTFPPQSQPFISVQAAGKWYDEIQLGLTFSGYHPPVPSCDNNCRSKHNDARAPVVYSCHQCSKGRVRLLCKKCAQEELSNPSALHEPDHELVQWQPTWPLDLAAGLQIPMLSPDMERFARSQTTDDVRALTFESRERFDDRAIRLFVPAPGGRCQITAKIQVWPIKNEKRHHGFLKGLEHKLKNVLEPQIVGHIAMSAHASDLSSRPIPPRKSVPQQPQRKSKDERSMCLDIKRTDDFDKLHTLIVEVDTGYSPQRAVELMLQDVYNESDEYEEHPFKWTLKFLGIKHIPKPAPSFASVAQWEMHRRRKHEEWQKTRDQDREHWNKWMEDFQEKQDRYAELEEKRQQRQQQQQAPTPLPSRGRFSNDHGGSNHLRPDDPRPTSLPPRSRQSLHVPDVSYVRPSSAHGEPYLHSQPHQQHRHQYTPASTAGSSTGSNYTSTSAWPSSSSSAATSTSHTPVHSTARTKPAGSTTGSAFGGHHTPPPFSSFTSTSRGRGTGLGTGAKRGGGRARGRGRYM